MHISQQTLLHSAVLRDGALCCFDSLTSVDQPEHELAVARQPRFSISFVDVTDVADSDLTSSALKPRPRSYSDSVQHNYSSSASALSLRRTYGNLRKTTPYDAGLQTGHSPALSIAANFKESAMT
jgi:hypothetical protein